jgi:hypothetical protein
MPVLMPADPKLVLLAMLIACTGSTEGGFPGQIHICGA